MAGKLNGSAKWIMLALVTIGTIVTLTLSFADKASNCDLQSVEDRITPLGNRVTAVESDVKNQEKTIDEVKQTVDKIYDLLLKETGGG